MLGSTRLEMTIGLALMYLMLSLLCSAVRSAYCKRRPWVALVLPLSFLFSPTLAFAKPDGGVVADAGTVDAGAAEGGAADARPDGVAPTRAGEADASRDPATKAKPSSPSVEKVCVRDRCSDRQSPLVIAIGDDLRVTFAQEIAAFAADQRPSLWIGDIQLAHLGVARSDDRALTFHIDQVPEDKESWARLMAKRERELDLRLGFANGTFAPDGSAPVKVKVKLDVTSRARLGGFAVLCYVVIAIILRIKPNMVCDAGATVDPGNPPYSLSASQGLLWFVTIFGAFSAIGIATGALPTFSSTALILLGISIAGGLGAKAVGLGKDQPSAGASNADVKLTSESLLKDMLTDDSGVTLPRLQQLLWTVVVSGVFWVRVVTDVAMPDLADTLLALMGLSAGAHVAFKPSEKQTPEKKTT